MTVEVLLYNNQVLGVYASLSVAQAAMTHSIGPHGPPGPMPADCRGWCYYPSATRIREWEIIQFTVGE
jgi:hypothetical protein